MIGFKSVLFDKDKNNSVFVFVDRLGKGFIFIPYKKTITVLKITKSFLIYIYRYYKTPESIVLDRGP
jgi:hypothetical protein